MPQRDIRIRRNKQPGETTPYRWVFAIIAAGAVAVVLLYALLPVFSSPGGSPSLGIAVLSVIVLGIIVLAAVAASRARRVRQAPATQAMRTSDDLPRRETASEGPIRRKEEERTGRIPTREFDERREPPHDRG